MEIRANRQRVQDGQVSSIEQPNQSRRPSPARTKGQAGQSLTVSGFEVCRQLAAENPLQTRTGTQNMENRRKNKKVGWQ